MDAVGVEADAGDGGAVQDELVYQSEVVGDVVDKHVTSLMPGRQEALVLADEGFQASDRPVHVVVLVLLLWVPRHDFPLDFVRA